MGGLGGASMPPQNQMQQFLCNPPFLMSGNSLLKGDAHVIRHVVRIPPPCIKLPRLRTSYFQKCSKIVPDDSWIDPGSTNKMLETCSNKYSTASNKCVSIDPRAPPSCPENSHADQRQTFDPRISMDYAWISVDSPWISIDNPWVSMDNQ